MFHMMCDKCGKFLEDCKGSTLTVPGIEFNLSRDAEFCSVKCYEDTKAVYAKNKEGANPSGPAKL